MTASSSSTPAVGHADWSPDFEGERALFDPRGIHTRPFNGETNDWITPAWLIEALGPFDLDPCASTAQPWPCAARSLTYHEDGLRTPWEGRVWLNPPYGPNTQRWLHKLAEHGNGMALVPARTETQWFHLEVWNRATAILFLVGRLTFHRPSGEPGSGNSGHASVVVAYSEPDADKLRALAGVEVRAWERRT